MKLAPEMERQVERLMVLADMPQLIKPFRAADVQNALDTACSRLSTICQEVGDYLDRFKNDLGFTNASASLSSSSEDKKFLPNQRGITTDSNYQVWAQGYWQPSAYFLVSAGAIVYDDDTIPTAYISFGNHIAQVDIGWREYWFSPFQDSAMLISTNAEPSPSVAVSNTRPLTGTTAPCGFSLQFRAAARLELGT